MSQARDEAHGAVAVITLDNPPVNGLDHALRSELVAALHRAQEDPAIRALVLIGVGKAFSGGADIKEFDGPMALAEPTLRDVIVEVEASPKPVVAAMHSVCMGGGLELALGCHYRVASPGTQIALPEVKLGLLPGAGGTQRLPRAVGLDTALEMVVSGAPVSSERLAESGLFDRRIDGELLAGAIAFAAEVADRRPLPRTRDRRVEHSSPERVLDATRATVEVDSANFPAPLQCVEAVAAAVHLPFEDGMRLEREHFLELAQSPQSRALRHAFFAERAASRVPDVPGDTPTRSIAAAAVVGAGTMGCGIAMCFANVGIPVTVLEVTKDALDKGLATIRRNYESSARKGKLTGAQVEQRLGLIRATLEVRDLAQADLVVEAAYEDLAVKREVFRQLDEVMKPGAILATNTSTLDVDAIASFTRRPQDVIGTHFFSPANVMRLLEIVRGRATSKEVLATVMGLSRRLKKTGVVARVCDGFIGNRMLEQYLRQCMFLLEEGALPQQVDQALEAWGWRMGPFRVSDLAGNDVSWAIRKRRAVEKPGVITSKVADLLCERGRFGQKTGLGWYRYDAGRRDAIPDPEVQDLIETHRKSIGVVAREISGDEIVERCVLALVNEGAKILEEGIALRASDIDLTGYGFPSFRGGPMYDADRVGLERVVHAMARYAQSPNGDAGFWMPAPLLRRLAEEGRTFGQATGLGS